MSVEELKASLTKQVIDVMDLCDEIMKHEGHVGILDVTTMLFIGALYSACGRVRNVEEMKKEEFIYPLPPLKAIEATFVGITEGNSVEESGEEAALGEAEECGEEAPLVPRENVEKETAVRGYKNLH